MSTALTPFTIATERLLQPADLELNALQQVLDQMLTHQVDYADLYFQLSHQESWALEEGLIKESHYHVNRGVGVRALSGEKTGFAYSDELQLPALLEAAQAARSIARHGQQQQVKVWQQRAMTPLYTVDDPLASLSAEEKVSLLKELDQAARQIDPRITQVSVSLRATHKLFLIAASDGTLTADIQPLVRLNVAVLAEQNGRREQGSAGGGARTGYDFFTQEQRGLQYVQDAVRRALLNLESVPAPAGSMPVVLAAGWPGVLLHEAVGHGLEGDSNRKGSSAFSQRLGQKVASPLCTIVDDGTLSQLRGSINIDDEGTPSQCTTLIENGILTAYMQDKLNARLMGMPCTGNGRRESYAHTPLPRMTNTYMLAGNTPPAEIIASVDKGLYAVNFAGGQVDTTSGKFVFSANEAYLIEHGRITRPVKGATLIGNGLEVLNRVSMVGNDLALDSGVGICGKDGQQVPVGVGQPTLRVDSLTVGGTQT